MPQDTVDRLDPLRLSCPRLNPLTGLGPGLVQGQQTALASPLDQLIWLCNELGTRSQQPRVCGLGLVEDALDVGIGSKVQRCELGRGVVCRGCRQRSGLDDRSAGEVVVEDGLAVGLEDGFGRHGAAMSNKLEQRVSEEGVRWEESSAGGGKGSGRLEGWKTQDPAVWTPDDNSETTMALRQGLKSKSEDREGVWSGGDTAEEQRKTGPGACRDVPRCGWGRVHSAAGGL
jgi:hypothetical protein